MKNLYNFFNKDNLPWLHMICEKYYTTELPGERMVGFGWWRAHLELLLAFKSTISCKAGSGFIVKLSHDTWADKPLWKKFLELHSFAKNENQCLNYMVNSLDISEFFHTPPPPPARAFCSTE